MAGNNAFYDLDRFQFLRTLGQGGMGSVHEVFDHVRGVQVALKTVGRVSGRSLWRFKREFRAIRDLHHPNVVRLGELLEVDGQWHYSMERIQGLDFVAYVRDSDGSEASDGSHSVPTQRLSPEVVSESLRRPDEHPLARVDPKPAPLGAGEPRLRHALVQLCEALRFVHEAGRVHRDLKPSNVLVANTGRVVLLDFGLVGRLDDETEREEVVGTPGYMAPEQAAGGHADPASDWYSLGVMLYQALTGVMPYTGTTWQILMAKSQREPQSPNELCAGLPDDLVALCMSLLARDPAERPGAADIPALFRRTSGALPSGSEGLPRNGVPWVGREEELERLHESVEGLRSKLQHGLMLTGPSGIGKTALLERCLGELRNRPGAPVLVLRGRCRQYEEVSFKAFDEVMDRMSDSLLDEIDATPALDPNQLAALLRAFPVLHRVHSLTMSARRHDQKPDNADPGQMRLALYAAVRRLFRLISASHHLVLVLEDLHWADSESWGLLEALTRDPEPPPMLLLMSSRSDLEGVGDGILDDRERVLLRQHIEQMTLEPLSQAQARTLAESVAEGALDGSDALEAVVRESEGYPLFVTTMVRFALRRPGDKADGLRLQDALWEEVCELPELDRQLVAAACLSGCAADRSVLAGAVGSAVGELADPVERLLEGGMLRVVGDGYTGPVEPHHDQIRQAVLSNMGADEQRDYHLRLAEAFHVVDGGEGEAVRHYHLAGQQERAAASARVAAQRAMELLAFEQAVRLYRQALDWGEHGPDAQRELRIKLADALSHAGLGREAAEAYLEVARPGDIADARLRAMGARHLLAAGEVTRGKQVLASLLRELGLTMPESALSTLGAVLWTRLRLRLRGTDPGRVHDEPLPEADQVRLELCGSVALVLSTVDPFLGGYFGTVYALLALASGQREHIVRALMTEGAYRGLIADRASGQPLIQNARAVLQDRDVPYLRALLDANESAVAWAHADYTDALDKARSAHRVFGSECRRVSWELLSVELVETNALFFLARYRELASRVPRYLRASEQRTDRYGATNMLVSQASVRFLVDNVPQAAADAVSQGLKDWDTGKFDMHRLMALQVNVYVHFYRGDYAAALAELEGQRTALGRSLVVRLPIYRVLVDYLDAQVSLGAAGLSPTNRRHWLRRARRLADRLRRARVPLGPALAPSIDLAVRCQCGEAISVHDVATAAGALDRLGLKGHSASLRLTMSTYPMLPVEETSRLSRAGLRFLLDSGVKKPDMFARVLSVSAGTPVPVTRRLSAEASPHLR